MKKIILFTLLTLLCLPFLAQAAGLVPCGGAGEPACTFCHIFLLFNNIVEFVMIKIVPLLAVLMLVIGGFLFFFAGAAPDTLKKAKSIITSTVIGLVIVYASWAIVNTLLVQSGLVNPETGRSLYQWWEINCQEEEEIVAINPKENPNQVPTPKGQPLLFDGLINFGELDGNGGGQGGLVPPAP